MKIRTTKLVTALCGVVAMTLAGCGGSGESTPAASTILSGTAAGGAAIIGNVIVTDSLGATKSAAIAADGRYTIDVSGMTGPFVLKAAGTVGNTSVTYYSAATQADLGGTVNVTPFTNMIVSNIAAQMAETYFSDSKNIANIGALITPTALTNAQVALKEKLQPVLTALGVNSSIDLLRTSFATDHSGLDAVLDLVKVEVDTSTNIVTLKNALTSVVLGSDNVTTSTDDKQVVAATDVTTTAATDLQLVLAKLDAFAKLFATGIPSTQAIKDSGTFDTSASFMMSGKTFDQFATEMSTQQDLVGLKFSNVDISPDANNTEGVLILTAIVSSSTDTVLDRIRLKLVKVNGVWLVQGDGRKVDISIHAQAQAGTWVNSTGSGSNSIQNGLNVWIDPFAYNSNVISGTFSGGQVASALVTGPGLSTGVTFDQSTQDTWLKLAGQSYNTNLIPECTTAVTTQCVNIADTVDNGIYTIVLKNAAGTSLNGSGYLLKLSKKPYTTSELTAAMFPAFTSITIDGQAVTPNTLATLAVGKTVAASWTMPSALKAKYANIWANGANGTQFYRVEKDLLPTATSALFAIESGSGTATSTGIWLEGADIYGRRLAVSGYIGQ